MFRVEGLIKGRWYLAERRVTRTGAEALIRRLAALYPREYRVVEEV